MKKMLLGLVTAGLVLTGVLVALVMPRHGPVNRTACERIEKGMTVAQVEQILGGPPGDYRTQPTKAEAWGGAPWEDFSFSGSWET
jgi:hypothetical protein